MSSNSKEAELNEVEEMELAELLSRSSCDENKENEETLDDDEDDMELCSPQPRNFPYSSPNNPRDNTLLKRVRNKKLKTKHICESWIKLYSSDAKAALIQLLQFVLEASGSQYLLPSNLKFPFDNMDILIMATAHFGNKSLAYPLIMKSADIYVEEIRNFVQQLLSMLQTTSIITDKCFLKSFAGFLMVCSDSKVRPFRHTSTLIALKMMTILNSLVTWEQPQLKEIWLQMFANVFLPRSSDVVDDIRHLCIAECGSWLRMYPHCFVDLQHLQHIYDALKDSCPKVCEASLKALLQLFHNPKLQAFCLEQGINHRVTLLGLCLSSESELAQMSVRLLITYYRVVPHILDVSMQHVLEQLIFASHRGVAQAAAELVALRYKHASSDKERILVLIEVFLEFQQHDHTAYLVDAFYGHINVVLAWQSMVSMLLDDETLSARQSTVLIDILKHAVKQAVTGEIPVGRYTGELVRQLHPYAKDQAGTIILPHLATLLHKYRNCSQDLRNLFELPQYMSLGHLQLTDMLEQFKDLLFEQEQLLVLQMGAKTLERLNEQQLVPCDFLETLLNNVVTNYKIAANAWLAYISESSTKRLLMTLRLLSAFYACFDLDKWQLSDNLLAILQQASANSSVASPPTEALTHYLSIVYVALSWDLKRVQDLANQNQDVADECYMLSNRLKKFFSINFAIIKAESLFTDVACDAFVYLCDLFVLFADHLRKSSNGSIQALEYKSKRTDHEQLEAFLERYVFDGSVEGSVVELLEPHQFDVLQSKRRVLVSYLKLVFHNVMPMMRACVVYQYYEQYHPVFGDIMRATMERSLSMNPTNFGMTVMHTCLLVYRRIRTNYPNAFQAAASPDFNKLLKLAKLLAELFYIKPLEVRSGVAILHRAGIRFAVEITPDDPSAAPKDLLYLSVVQQFVPQLLDQDIRDVLESMKFIEQAPLPSRSDEWQPLFSYRNSLEISLRVGSRR
ncbi:cohesin subunit SA-2 [Drosophila nasuta]|uniref:cohesin subunit SA-2 n=1 Tax=Drosophila nasuta TaxID=42062 RepID=UPI00295F02B8|nr:cohesin subunit SA-2 [Drosophila nasuta]